ncbi:hypothetical protein K503DRAFT_777414 [Rhizopogon vinicolor AM-OR11-026]|uniref:Yeast cell wall synthesis Kre9/Knh1-like N-terminal domain-containing protein n=1 Tax=Rhizopogon vinicolor AM-OR11-026 TaxID=1314800 RepID=A0A1B7MGA8_9AGAM|nr:hypothetical protein K503DRAFT_777414 [Rhizopogon vinicolor AM-OR11-026]
MFHRLALASVAFLGVVSAQLTITSPSADDWWVAQSLNILAWTCNTSPYQNFTILLTNSNLSILPAPLALIAVQENFDCSATITQQQSAQPAGTGYVVQLSSTINATDVYAQSEPFEIKALGATYPTTTFSAGSSATGSSATASSATASSATTSSATASSATASSATTSSASPTTTGAALAQYVPVGLSMAAALALSLVIA